MAKANRVFLQFPIFANYQVSVIFTPNIPKAVKKLGGEVSKNTDACFVTKKGCPGEGWLVFGLNPSADAIAHECWHCISALLKFVGAKREEEVVAYHLGYLVGKIHEHLEAR